MSILSDLIEFGKSTLFDQNSTTPPDKQPDGITKLTASGKTLVLQQAKNHPGIRRWMEANPTTPLHTLPFDQANEQWRKTVDPNSDLPKDAHKLDVLKAVILHHQTHEEAKKLGHTEVHGKDVLHEDGIKESYREGHKTEIRETPSRIKQVDTTSSNPYADGGSISWDPFGSGEQKKTPPSPEYAKYREASHNIFKDIVSLNTSYLTAADDYGVSGSGCDYALGKIKIPIGIAELLKETLGSFESGIWMTDKIEMKRDYGYMGEEGFTRWLRTGKTQLAEKGITYNEAKRQFRIDIGKTEDPAQTQKKFYQLGYSINVNVDDVPYRISLRGGVSELKKKVVPETQKQETGGTQKEGDSKFKTKNPEFTDVDGKPIVAEIVKHPKFGSFNLKFDTRFSGDGELSESLKKGGWRWSPREKVYFHRDNDKAESFLTEHFGYGEEETNSEEPLPNQVTDSETEPQEVFDNSQDADDKSEGSELHSSDPAGAEATEHEQPSALETNNQNQDPGNTETEDDLDSEESTSDSKMDLWDMTKHEGKELVYQNRPTLSDEVEDGMFSSAHSFSGANHRWAAIRTSGASDDDIRAQLTEEFGTYGGQSGINGAHVDHSGGKNPKITIRFKNGEERQIKGTELVNLARKVLKIPKPGETSGLFDSGDNALVKRVYSKETADLPILPEANKQSPTPVPIKTPEPVQPQKSQESPVNKYGDLFSDIPENVPQTLISNHPSRTEIESISSENKPVNPATIQAIRQGITEKNLPKQEQIGFDFENELPSALHKEKMDKWSQELLGTQYQRQNKRGGQGIIKNNPNTGLLMSKDPTTRRWQTLPDTTQINLFQSLFGFISRGLKNRNDDNQFGFFDQPQEPKQNPIPGQTKQFGDNPEDTRVLKPTPSGKLRWFDSPSWGKVNEDIHRKSITKLGEIRKIVKDKADESIEKFGKDKTALLLDFLHDHHRKQAQKYSDAIQVSHDNGEDPEVFDQASQILNHHIENHHADEYQKVAKNLKGEEKPRSEVFMDGLFGQSNPQKKEKVDPIDHLFGKKEEKEQKPAPNPMDLFPSGKQQPKKEATKTETPKPVKIENRTDQADYIPFTDYDKTGSPKGKQRFSANLEAMILLGKTLEMQSFAAGQFAPEKIEEAEKILKGREEWTYTEFRHACAEVSGFDRDNYNTLLTQMPIKSAGEDQFSFDPDYVQEAYSIKDLTPEMIQKFKSYSGWGGTDIKDANEFYTPNEVVEAQWEAMRLLGYKGGITLEPSCGTGRYIDHRNTDTIMVGVELDPVSAMISKLTHPQDLVVNQAFEFFCLNNEIRFNGTVANVPFGDRKAFPSIDGTPFDFTKHEDYFVYKALENGAEGSVHSFIVPTGFLENRKIETIDPNISEAVLNTPEGKKYLKYSSNEDLARQIQKYGEFLGAIRLPDKTFREAGTSVTSDVLFFRRRPDDVVEKFEKTGIPEKFLNIDMSNHYFQANEHHLIGEKVIGNWGREAARGTFDGEQFRKIASEIASKPQPDYKGITSKPVPEQTPPAEGDTRKHEGKNWLFKNGKWSTRPYATELFSFKEFGYKSLNDMKIKFSDLDHALTATPQVLNMVDHPHVIQYDPKFRAFLSSFKTATGKVQENDRQKVFTAMLLGRVFHEGFIAASGDNPFDKTKIEKLLRATEQWTQEYGSPAKDPSLLLASRENSYASIFKNIIGEDGKVNPVIGGRTLSGEKVIQQKYDPLDAHSIMKSMFADSMNSDIDSIYDYYKGTKSKDKIREELSSHPDIGFDGKNYIPFTHAVSGQIYDRLEQYKQALESGGLSDNDQEKLRSQIAKINETKPVIPINQIPLTLQSKYVPIEVKNAFLREHLGNDNIQLAEVNNAIVAQPTENETRTGWRKYQIADSHEDISITNFEDYLNGTVRSGANDDLGMLEDDFKIFIEGSKEFHSGISERYSRMMANYVEPEYSMVPIEIPGFVKANPKTGRTDYILHPFTYATIRKMDDVGRGVIALDVGLGKTAAAIGLSALRQNKGISRKAGIACEINNVAKWYNEIMEWYPEAKVAIAGCRFKTDRSGTVMLDIKGQPIVEQDPDWDGNMTRIVTGAHTHVIIPHSVLSPSTTSDRFISLGHDNYMKHELDLLKMTTKGMIQELATKAKLDLSTVDMSDIGDREQLLSFIKDLAGQVASKTAEDDKKGKSGKDIVEETMNKLNRQVKMIMDANPTLRPGKTGYGNTYTFENLNIDEMYVDESHNFKSLFSEPATDVRGSGMNMGTSSNSAINMFMLTRHLLKKNENRGVYFLTATPITAKPHECFNVATMIAPDLLKKEFGIDNVTDFMNMFGHIEGQYTYNTRGEIENKNVVAGFKEANGLRNFLFRILEMKNATNATVFDPVENKLRTGLKIPEEVHHQHVIPMNDYQQEKMDEYVNAIRMMNGDGDVGPSWLYDSGRKRGGRTIWWDKRSDKEVLVTTVMAWLNRLCVDPALDTKVHNPEEKTERFNKVCSNIAESYKNGGKNLAFLDGFEIDKKTTYFDKIKRELVNHFGIPENEIAIITGSHSATERYDTAMKYEAGKVKIILGSSAMETGMDLQHDTTDIHHLDQPWNSTNKQQRNGRGVRQGNKKPHVNIHQYFSQNGYDFYRNMTQQRKADMLDHLYNGNSDKITTSSDEVIEKLRALAMISPNPEKRLADIDERIGKYEEAKKSNEDGRHARDVHNYIRSYKEQRQAIHHYKNVAGKLKRKGYLADISSFNIDAALDKHADLVGDYSKRTISEQLRDIRHSPNVHKGIATFASKLFPDNKPKRIKYFKDMMKFLKDSGLLRDSYGNEFPLSTGEKPKFLDARDNKDRYIEILKKRKDIASKYKGLTSIYENKIKQKADSPFHDMINDRFFLDTRHPEKMPLPSGHLLKEGQAMEFHGIRDEQKDTPVFDTKGNQTGMAPNTDSLIGKGHKVIMKADDISYDEKRKMFIISGQGQYVSTVGGKKVSTPVEHFKISQKDLMKNYKIDNVHDDPETALKKLLKSKEMD